MRRNLRYDYVIVDLLKQQRRLDKVVGVKPKYDSLIDYLIKWDVEVDLKTEFLAEVLSLKRQDLLKGLKWLYDYCQRQDVSHKLVFSQPEIQVVFFLEVNGQSYSFVYNGLYHLPRKGEQVDLPFFRERWGGVMFFVDRVIHDFNDREQSVSIFLELGDYNMAWDIEKGKAELNGKLAWDDFLKSDYQLKEKLGFKH